MTFAVFKRMIMRRKQFAITDKYWNFPSSTDVNQPLHHIQIQVIFEKKK